MQNGTKTLGYVGVDSGQVVIIDPAYVWDDSFNPNGDPTGEPYDSACRITLGEQQGGEVNEGVASATMYGDGNYPVIATYRDGKIASLTIDFDPEPYDSDEDEDEDWDEDEDEDED